jgi:hypothetical protein
MLLKCIMIVVFVLAAAAILHAVEQRPQRPQRGELAPPVIEGRWVRPAEAAPAQPVWGHAEGLRIGLAPLPGPRGLLRVYAPFLGRDELWPINFIAVEPIPTGHHHRGLSELERSRWDNVRGKRFWSTYTRDDYEPRPPEHPARGVIEEIDGVEVLRVYVQIEPFDNGARPILRLTFRADRPQEVGVAVTAHPESAPMADCIITATMGNHARLRRLHLAERIVLSTELWPDYREDGFTPHARFSRAELFENDEGHVVVSATPDEADPERAVYAEGTGDHWKYRGAVATQYWRHERPHDRLAVQVNGRFTYWASRHSIPGGISYENFELIEPFEDGQEAWFGITTRAP